MSVVGLIASRDYCIHALAGAFLLLTSAVLWRNAVVSALFATTAFTVFDLIGYKWLCDQGDRKDLVPYYRMMQVMFQAVLYLTVWLLAGWQAAAASALIWWTGGCDLLYYWIGFYKLFSSAWTWLWWTPVGLVPYLLGRRAGHDHESSTRWVAMKTPAVVTQAIIGFIAAIALCILSLF